MIPEERLQQLYEAELKLGIAEAEVARLRDALLEIANGEWTGWASGAPRRIALDALEGVGT
jgi:hypothetical protein